MKNRTRKTTILLGLLLCAAVFSGCKEGTMDLKLQAIQGHWVDVNSEDTLDITGATMRYSSGEWREKYPFLIQVTDYATTLVPPKGKDFGPLSEIMVRDDGSLTAEEMVLDAEGHHFYFVREEEKAAMLEIRDISEDLPKTIESKDIRRFSLSFSKDTPTQYGLDEYWPCGFYNWTIEKDGDRWQMEFNVYGESYVILQKSCEVDQTWVEGLADLLQSAGIIQYNGYHYKNEANRHDWYLLVDYTSKEKLTIRAEGDAAAECVFDLPTLLEFAKTQGVAFD